MIEIPLHHLAIIWEPEDSKHREHITNWIPEAVHGFCDRIAAEAEPLLKAKAKATEDEARETAQDIGEELPPAVENPPRERGDFERTTLFAFGEWCADRKEVWMERACKFLIKNHDVRIERFSYYSGCWRWRFAKDSMPARWKGFDANAYTVLGLIGLLALEIQERMAAISVD